MKKILLLGSMICLSMFLFAQNNTYLYLDIAENYLVDPKKGEMTLIYQYSVGNDLKSEEIEFSDYKNYLLQPNRFAYINLMIGKSTGVDFINKTILNLKSNPDLVRIKFTVTDEKAFTMILNAVDFSILNQLKEIVIYSSWLDVLEIPESIFKIKSLKTLIAKDLKLAVINNSIGNLTELENLDLSDNNLKYIPQEITKLTNLSYLNLGNNPLEAIPQNIDKFRRIKYLNLSNSKISSLLKTNTFPTLDTLIISNSKIDSIPDNIAAYKALKVLDLENSDLVYISDKINDLQNLNYINLNKIPLSKDEVMSVIESNILYDYSIKEVFDLDFAFKHPAYLGSIKLSLRSLVALGARINEFKRLKKLEIVNFTYSKNDSTYVSSNKILDFYEPLSKLDSLQELYCYLNDRDGKDYTDYFNGIDQLKNLRILDLSDMKLKSFPPDICNLSGLESLNMRFNEITILPNEFSQLQELKVLVLRVNCFNEFPIIITENKKLEYVDLRNNHINEIPIEVGELKNLKKLLLNNITNEDGYGSTYLNKIIKIPDELLWLYNSGVIITD